VVVDVVVSLVEVVVSLVEVVVSLVEVVVSLVEEVESLVEEVVSLVEEVESLVEEVESLVEEVESLVEVVTPGVVPAEAVASPESLPPSEAPVEVAVWGALEPESEVLSLDPVSPPPGPGPGKPPNASFDAPLVHAAASAHAPRTTIPRIFLIVAVIGFARWARVPRAAGR
jgi:hypothetical protein